VSVEKVSEAMDAIQFPNVKSIQIIFNMFRQKPAEEFFQEAAKRNIAIIARVPLASGLLTGKMSQSSSFPTNDHRNYNIKGDAFDVGETFSGVNFNRALKVVEELKLLAPEGFSLSQLALKWILMHDAVSVVIPGAKNSDQVLKNISASSLPDINNLMKKIEEIYITYLKDDIHPHW
jgi:aryl-alcohol dehydrogenase-like predicted oxidoreductase